MRRVGKIGRFQLIKLFHKRNVSLGLALILAIVLLTTGCADSGSPSAGSASASAASSSASVTVTDVYGRKVKVPKEVKTVAAIGGAARILTYAGCADKLVGVTDMDKKDNIGMPYSVVNAKYFTSLPSVGAGGANDTPYIEQLVELHPDVIIGLTDQDTIQNVAEKTGIPTLGIDPQDVFDDSFYSAMELVGQVMGTQEHCQKVIDYVKECREDLNTRTKDIPDSEKPAVYVGAVSFRGGHGFEGTYADYPPFRAIHAKNVADETGKTGAFLVDLEKVAVWNPDIVFLTPGNMSLVNGEYQKDPSFYQGLKAVKNGAVYTQIAYNYNWSNMELAIADAYYAGKVIYPKQFSDIDPAKKADEIFTAMLGEPMYDQLVASGQSFGPLTIGETGK